jgi:hypothetical protein
MLPHILRKCAVVVPLALIGTAALYGQSAVEYGNLASGTAGAALSAKPIVPAMGLPGGASSPAAGARSSSRSNAAASPEAVAKANRQFFQSHAGPDAAQISLHTIPDHAQAWIDGKFVGPTPFDLKLAPGHHRVLVRATNMQESTQEFDLTAKQTQAIEVTLKSGYQNQVIIQWPSQK